MPAKRKKNPKYRYHKARGCAVVTIGGKDHYLGTYDSPESWAKYHRLIAEWAENGYRLQPAAPEPAPAAAPSGPTVNELILRYFTHAEQYYRRPDGTQTNEVEEYRRTLAVLRRLYGPTPAAEFGPLALKACRQQMILDGLSRGVVNQRVGRLKRAFAWAVENELVPPSVYHGLQAVKGLKKGRSEARETDPIKPVAPHMIEAVLPHMTRQVAAMVRVQQLTGCRPGEVCVMRACDLDMTGKVWLYRPGSDIAPVGQHKTAHHGKGRVIAIGPQAQEVIKPFLKLDLQAYLYSPREARQEYNESRRRERKSKVQPSQVCRKKANPRKKPGDRYHVTSYAHAIYKACDAAFSPPAPLARGEEETAKKWLGRLTDEQKAELKAWRKAHRWHPNQLRHSRATEIRRRFGLEAAQVVLGHSRADVTQIYAETDLATAERIAAEIG